MKQAEKLIAELRFTDIGYERKQEILEQTKTSWRRWVIYNRPTFEEHTRKFPPLKDLGIHVIIFISIYYIPYVSFCIFY